MKGIALIGIALAASCGRLDFDGYPPTVEIVAGASTADLELCAGDATYWLTSAPVAAGWTADTLEDRIRELPPSAVLHKGQTGAGRDCTTVASIEVGPEQIQIHAYVVSRARGEVAEATAAMQPTWTREVTPGGVTVWVHRPEAVYRDPSASMPALVFLHGWGHSTNVNSEGRGVDTMPRDSAFLELFGQDIAGADPDRETAVVAQPFLVLAPNCVEGGTLHSMPVACWGWASGPAIYDETMRYARDRFPIDRRRVYVTGLSTGGLGAFRLAITRPDEIAAVVPIGSTIDSAWFSAERCKGIAVPVWAFHSSNDVGQTSYTNSQFMVDQLNTCAPAPVERARVDLGDWWLRNQGHAGFYEVYSDGHGKANGAFTSIYAWLLAHTR